MYLCIVKMLISLLFAVVAPEVETVVEPGEEKSEPITPLPIHTYTQEEEEEEEEEEEDCENSQKDILDEYFDELIGDLPPISERYVCMYVCMYACMYVCMYCIVCMQNVFSFYVCML